MRDKRAEETRRQVNILNADLLKKEEAQIQAEANFEHQATEWNRRL